LSDVPQSFIKGSDNLVERVIESIKVLNKKEEEVKTKKQTKPVVEEQLIPMSV
jgi:hypothetical protein